MIASDVPWAWCWETPEQTDHQGDQHHAPADAGEPAQEATQQSDDDIQPQGPVPHPVHSLPLAPVLREGHDTLLFPMVTERTTRHAEQRRDGHDQSGADAVRVGLVGAGFAAGLHLRAYRACGNPAARVVAIAGGHLARAQDVAGEYAVPDVYDDYRRLLDRPDVDVDRPLRPELPPPAHRRRRPRRRQAPDRREAPDRLLRRPGRRRSRGRDAAGDHAPRCPRAAPTPSWTLPAGAGRRLMYAENFVYAPAIAARPGPGRRRRRADPGDPRPGVPLRLPRRLCPALAGGRRGRLAAPRRPPHRRRPAPQALGRRPARRGPHPLAQRHLRRGRPDPHAPPSRPLDRIGSAGWCTIGKTSRAGPAPS